MYYGPGHSLAVFLFNGLGHIVYILQPTQFFFRCFSRNLHCVISVLFFILFFFFLTLIFKFLLKSQFGIFFLGYLWLLLGGGKIFDCMFAHEISFT